MIETTTNDEDYEKQKLQQMTRDTLNVENKENNRVT